MERAAIAGAAALAVGASARQTHRQARASRAMAVFAIARMGRAARTFRPAPGRTARGGRSGAARSPHRRRGRTAPGAARLYACRHAGIRPTRSEEHTSELQSLMRISYAVFCLNKKKHMKPHHTLIKDNHNIKL